MGSRCYGLYLNLSYRPVVLNRDAEAALGALKNFKGAANLQTLCINYMRGCRQIVVLVRKGAASEKRLRNNDLD